MPHTNRKKKSSAANNSTAGRPTTKPTIVHTKRQEVQDDDGWTHVVDTPRSRRGGRGTTNTTSSSSTLTAAGDFEVNGVSYVDRTLEELRADYEFWKKGWEESEACKGLRAALVGREGSGEEKVAAEGKIEAEEKNEAEEKPQTETEDTVVGQGEDTVTGTQEPPAVETAAPVTKTSEKVKVDNIVVLGLGSLQSARREGRRASATQLAALQTIIQTLSGGSGEQDIKVVLQEPQFTALDKEVLESFGYDVVEDPKAFSMITETSLVYAIHCYAQVYRSVSEAKRPAMLIGTDIENFWKFNLSETARVTTTESRGGWSRDAMSLHFLN